VASSDGIQHLTETHELGIFTHGEYMGAFTDAGLDVVHDPETMTRGMYIGCKKLDND
jgi:hypothetical protein